MPEIVNQSRINKLKMELEGIAKSIARVAPQLEQAIRDLLTAINYADRALMKSSLNSVLEGLRLTVRDIVQRELEASVAIKRGIQKGWQEFVEGVVCEDFDEVKSVIESFIDKQITSMTEVRDGMVKRLANDYPVENGQQLEDGIRDLCTFKENILKDWPSSITRPSPINRQAIADARKAIARGENGMHKEELIWGGKPSDKSS